jgi:hypothetical protein
MKMCATHGLLWARLIRRLLVLAIPVCLSLELNRAQALHMVRSLKLVDMDAIDMQTMADMFRKMQSKPGSVPAN